MKPSGQDTSGRAERQFKFDETSSFHGKSGALPGLGTADILHLPSVASQRCAQPGDIIEIPRFTPFVLSTLGEVPVTLYVEASPASAPGSDLERPNKLKTSWRWVVSRR
jgi:hypothetical protein